MPGQPKNRHIFGIYGHSIHDNHSERRHFHLKRIHILEAHCCTNESPKLLSFGKEIGILRMIIHVSDLIVKFLLPQTKTNLIFQRFFKYF